MYLMMYDVDLSFFGEHKSLTILIKYVTLVNSGNCYISWQCDIFFSFYIQLSVLLSHNVGIVDATCNVFICFAICSYS